MRGTCRLILLLLTAAASACAARQGATAAPPAGALPTLASRVETYWKHREAKDLASAYALYCRSYTARVTREDFVRLTRLTRFDIRGTRIVRIQETASGADVTIAYEYMAPQISIKPLTSETTEEWHRDPDGQWCRPDEPVRLPFPASRPEEPPAAPPQASH